MNVIHYHSLHGSSQLRGLNQHNWISEFNTETYWTAGIENLSSQCATRRALGRAHLPPTKVFQWLSE